LKYLVTYASVHGSYPAGTRFILRHASYSTITSTTQQMHQIISSCLSRCIFRVVHH
jgi:hypothetical protein